MNRNITGILYITLSSLSFGLIPILAKLSYKGGANTSTVLFLRFLFATLILCYFLIRNKISLKINLRQLMIVIALGIFGYSATTICLFASYDFIAVGMATTILYLYPALVTVLSLFIYKEKITKKKITSLLVSFTGIICLIGTRNINLSVRGIIWALLSALFYSIYVIGVSYKEIKKLNSYLLSFYISVVVSITMFFVGLTSNSLNFRISFYSLVCILLLAFISTVVALTAFLQGVRIIGPSRAAIFSNLEPFVSLFLGFLILGEKITYGMAAGSLLIIVSILILSVNKKDLSIKKD